MYEMSDHEDRMRLLSSRGRSYQTVLFSLHVLLLQSSSSSYLRIGAKPSLGNQPKLKLRCLYSRHEQLQIPPRLQPSFNFSNNSSKVSYPLPTQLTMHLYPMTPPCRFLPTRIKIPAQVLFTHHLRLAFKDTLLKMTTKRYIQNGNEVTLRSQMRRVQT